jgi:hypothetical protein
VLAEVHQVAYVVTPPEAVGHCPGSVTVIAL